MLWWARSYNKGEKEKVPVSIDQHENITGKSGKGAVCIGNHKVVT